MLSFKYSFYNSTLILSHGVLKLILIYKGDVGSIHGLLPGYGITFSAYLWGVFVFAEPFIEPFVGFFRTEVPTCVRVVLGDIEDAVFELGFLLLEAEEAGEVHAVVGHRRD